MITCTQCREHLVEKTEGLIADAASVTEVDQHLETCADCRLEYEQVAALQARLTRDARNLASTDTAEAVAARLAHERRPARGHWVVRYCLRAGMGLSAVAALMLVAIWLSLATPSASAAEILADALKAAVSLRSVHISAQMRTLPRDNFELIVLKEDMVPIEMWKRFGDGADVEASWRVEKPGRVVVMDGSVTTLWIKPNSALKASPSAGLVGWIGNLMDVEKVLQNEISLAQRQGSTLTSRQTTNASGKQELEVIVEAKAQGDYSQSDWLRNSSIAEYDNRRIYRFDPQTKRLAGLDVYVHAQPKDILVFTITKVEYNPELGDTLFALELPKDIHWIQLPAAALPEKYAAMRPEQVAAEFFQAISEQRWDDVRTLMPISLDERTRQALAGLKVLRIGQPFKSGQYPGVFIPYEIRFASGETKKHNLALRNDNPAKRWTVDGGF